MNPIACRVAKDGHPRQPAVGVEQLVGNLSPAQADHRFAEISYHNSRAALVDTFAVQHDFPLLMAKTQTQPIRADKSHPEHLRVKLLDDARRNVARRQGDRPNRHESFNRNHWRNGRTQRRQLFRVVGHGFHQRHADGIVRSKRTRKGSLMQYTIHTAVYPLMIRNPFVNRHGGSGGVVKIQRAAFVSIASLCCSLGAASAAATDATQPKADSTTWTGGTDPKTVGEAIALNLAKRPFANRAMPYPDVCTAYGSLRLAVAVKDQDLIDKLVGKYAMILKPEGKRYVPNPTNVDLSVFGILPFELYRQTKDEQYLSLGKHSADAQWAKPDANGLTSQTRFWLDDMFMIIALQTEAYRVVKDPLYLDRASHEMVAYIDKLQLPSGLFYHSNGPGLFCWGRS